eukprot:GHRQ01018825.1.p3 GENE.GHRQ01018825.1~~GHRQ01018825.1.p3  ORF type:complete len:111 (-),score=19.84 GHRQ01018825.1:645-977(-)
MFLYCMLFLLLSCPRPNHVPLRQVYLASSAPPVRFPNVYGVDMPNRKEFVAHGLTEDQVRAVDCYAVLCHVTFQFSGDEGVMGVCSHAQVSSRRSAQDKFVLKLCFAVAE